MRRIARAFAMTPEAWERHANPWSFWTRVAILPALTLVLMLREELGSLTWILFALLVIWAWVNPRAFPPPASNRRWESRAVMGERVWIAGEEDAVTEAQRRRAGPLSLAPIVGMPPLVWGIVMLDWTVAMVGLLLTIGLKFCFLAAMAQLFDDAAARHPRYADWLR